MKKKLCLMLVIAILFTAAACEKSADKKAMNPAKKQKKNGVSRRG